MEIDLITIFPSVAFETKKWENGKEVVDPETRDEFIFNNAHVVSYKKLKSNPDVLCKEYIKHIEEIHNKIIDSNGNNLDDYIIVVDKSVDYKGIIPPTPDSQQLITYFSFHQALDMWVSIDFIKIVCFKNFGRSIYINNEREHWNPKFSFLLDIEQNHKGKLAIYKDMEGILIEVFSKCSVSNADTYKRIMNAIALFNESCRINKFSPNSSIVLLVGAIESLLDLPTSTNEYFAHSLKLFWGLDKRIEKWAKDLYKLRSQIVHGNPIEGEKLLVEIDRHYPHFEIAREMFHDCILFILDEYGYCAINREYKFEVITKLRNKIISNKEKVSRILKQKKKFSYTTFLNKKEMYKEFLIKIETLTPTDYSARDNMLELVTYIFSIAKDWIMAEKGKKYDTHNDKMLENYLISRNKSHDEILQLFSDILKMKWGKDIKLDIHDKINELKEKVRQLEPIVHHKNEFRFTISEFLDRSLYSIWAVY